MRFNDLKAALQPNIDDDLGKLYAEFVRTSGTGDLARFVSFLREQGHVDQKVLEELVDGGAIDASAVQDLARRNTPRPVSRLHAPTLMPDIDDLEDEEEEEAPSASTPAPAPGTSTPAPAPAPGLSEPAAAAEGGPGAGSSEAAEVADAADSGPSYSAPAGAEDASSASGGSSDEDQDEDAATATGAPVREEGERPKRRSEARATGGARRTGARSTGSRSGARRRSTRGEANPRRTGETRRTGQTTSARDRLKRTMFALRDQTDATNDDSTDLLRRDYKFVGKVGEGAMGRVLKAKDNDLLRLVAYKEMSEEIAANAALASKFYAEAQITAQLDHPNIVPVYQLEQSNDGMLAYTMKLIKGKTVEDYIDEVKEAYQKYGKGKLPEDYALEKRLDIFLRCCDALYYAHRRGVVHRDLKPENIMIGAYGEVYIMDWGIAKVVRNSDIVTEDPIDLLYEPQEEGDLIIGTPQYMSPEQANGDNTDLDHKSDQYSMGHILYELISLNQSVTGKSAMKIVMRQQDGEHDPMRHAFGDRIPRELKAIAEKAMTKDKTKRYQHIMDMADDVRHYLRDEAVQARPDSIFQATGRWVRRHTALTAFVVLTLLSIAGIGVITIGAGAAIYNAMAAARTTKVNGLRSSVFAQASKIDGQFIKYEGLLGTMSATASEKLTLSGADGTDFYTVSDFNGEGAEEGRTVPGTNPSDRYGYPVNLEYPVFVIPDGADVEVAEGQVRQLSDMGGNLRTVLLRSESEEAARFTPARYRRRIAAQGTPITWAFIGLESGAYVLYPGKGDISNFDTRKQPWYEDTAKVAVRQPGPRWSMPFPDFHGQGYVMTVSQPIFDVQGDLLGVAGVSLTFDYIIDALLQMPEEILGVREVLLLNAQGERIISTEDAGSKPAGGRSRAKQLSEFEVPEVVEAVQGFEKGGMVSVSRDGESQLVFYNRMEGLGWYLVVIGEESEMLSSDI